MLVIEVWIAMNKHGEFSKILNSDLAVENTLKLIRSSLLPIYTGRLYPLDDSTVDAFRGTSTLGDPTVLAV